MSLTRWKSPPAGSDVPEYHYTRLKGRNSIRLLKLLPGTGNKGIATVLVDSFICSPGQDSSYDALSYTWGDGQPNKAILCNGRRLLVTQTLLEALRHFRDPDAEITLWIDQVCICQERVYERNRQVQLMGDIFKSANKVFVWLGDHYDNSRAGMQLANHLLDIYQRHDALHPDQLDSHGLPKRGSKRWTALAAILRRPWFSRTWVVQEVVLNPNVQVVLGDSSLHWDELEKVVRLLEGPTSGEWQHDPMIGAWELPFTRINRIRLRHRRCLDSQESSHSAEILSASCEEKDIGLGTRDGIDLLDLLVMARGLGSSDPRDKVYALLGLSTSDVAPDYTQSPTMIFIEFATHIVGEISALNSNKVSSLVREARQVLVLLACAGGGRRCLEQRSVSETSSSLVLPSWVPDWTAPLLARPLVFDSRFQAGGKIFEVDWDPEDGLRLCGKLLDTVEVAGRVLLKLEIDDPSSYPHDKIKKWWQESQLIALTRIVRSPGSTMNVDAFEGLCRDLTIENGYFTGGQSHARKDTADEAFPQRRSLLDEAGSYQDGIYSAQHTIALGPTRGRVVFVTTTGYLGLAPHGTRPGDLIYVVLGASVPYVLRPRLDNSSFELVGEAYVQGIMQGEALEMDNGSSFESVFIH